MKKKTPYEVPKIDLIRIFGTDIIATSGDKNDIDEDFGENDGEWT